MSSGNPLYIAMVVGPTAIGKTKLSIELARHFDTHIVSADSRQFFREMNIGTAKPTSEELSAAPHHFINSLSIEEDQSAGNFEREALDLIAKLHKNHQLVIVTGGSGLYVNALAFGMDDLPANLKIRKQLMSRLENSGLESLVEELLRLDPLANDKVDMNNPQRVVRALEVCLASGKPFSSHHTNSFRKRPFEILWVGLDDDRAAIYERINKRVERMMEEGLLDEVRSLYSMKHLNALKTVGYRELFEYLDGECTLDEAVERVKKNTRNYAKRQLTWFRKNEAVHWFHPGQLESIVQYIESSMER